MKHTIVYDSKKPKEHLVLRIVAGDNVDVEVPNGYSKMTMEMPDLLLPVKQIYEKLGVEYIGEDQTLEEPPLPVIEKDYSKK